VPLKTRVSLVNQGVVTAKDGAMLAEGELIQTQDGEYHPNDPGVHQIRGRVEFNSAAEAEAIRAVRFLEFDNGTAVFVTLMGTEYRIADAGLTGSFGNLVSGVSVDASTLDSAVLNDIHYLVNGVDRGRAVNDDKSVEFHGMLQSAVPPTFTDTGIGTGFTLTVGAKVKYWLEERIKVDGIVIRRNAASTAPGLETVLTVTGDGTLIKPVLHRPIQLNPEATHWAIFATSTDGNFPVGAEIAELDFSIAESEDLRTGTDPLLGAGTLYETVTTTQAGQTFIVPKWGAPPISKTIDVYQDSLIMGDILDKQVVVFSFFDEPHSFPALNVFRFNTKERDEVVAVRTMDNFFMVILRDALWKVISLPRPEDSAFTPERFKVQIDGAFGIVNAVAHALFSFGTGLRLAYVSPVGIVVTDGSGWDILTDDLDWEATVNVALLSKCRLINNRAKYRLEFTYVPAGATEPTETAFLNYHPSHAKLSLAGGLKSKINWPIRRDANDIVMATLNGIYESFSVNADGKLYHHDVGEAEPVATNGIQFAVETGDIYLGGVALQNIVRKSFVRHSAAPGEIGRLHLVQHVEGKVDEEQVADIPLDFTQLSKVAKQGSGESVRFRFTKSGGASVRVSFFGAIFDTTGFAKGI